MRLEPLFDGELRFNEEAGVHVATYGADSDWIGLKGSKNGVHAAIAWYSWMRPPRRSVRSI